MGFPVLKFFVLCFLSSHALAAHHLIAGCRIYTQEGKVVATFPGRKCAFLDNGRVISMGSGFLRIFGPAGEVIQQQRLSSHADFTLSPDKKRILLVSSEPGDLPGDSAVYTLDIINESGYRMRTTDSIKIFGLNKKVMITDFRQASDGRYYVNLFEDGVTFLDSELLKITKKVTFPGTRNHQVRNVYLTDEGSFLFLHVPMNPDFDPAPIVEVREYRPDTGKLLLRYPPKPNGAFTFSKGGSLSLSEGKILLNHPLSGLYLISRRTGKLEQYITWIHNDDDFLRPPELIFSQDLGAFFERWKF